MDPIKPLSLLLAAQIALMACSQDDVKWETGREITGGLGLEEERIDEKWGLYRDDLVRSLDLMKAALQSARGDSSVADQSEFDELTAKIEALRSDAVAEVDTPSNMLTETRAGLRREFQVIRRAVDALLTRLDHNPDDIARWQDR